jgi:hypothetical protein
LSAVIAQFPFRLALTPHYGGTKISRKLDTRISNNSGSNHYTGITLMSAKPGVYIANGRFALVRYSALLGAVGFIAASAQAAETSALQPTAHTNVMRRDFAPSSTATTVTATSSGLRVYLDEKGRPTQNPKAAHVSIPVPANNNSHEGLVARPKQLPDGRVLYVTETKDRFQSFSIATIGADGKPYTTCITPEKALSPAHDHTDNHPTKSASKEGSHQ